MLKYKIQHKLGAGGMGEVFLADDVETGRKVALKILLPQFSGSAESRERFLREMKVCAGLDHPNIIKVHDYGESEGTLYFVMDYIEGTSLQDKIKAGPIDIHDGVDIAAGIAKALAYIHPRGLIHRDLKPANIMVDKRGEPVLLDFGLVKALSEVSLTATGKVLGTPRYMAPEMMLFGSVDLRADLYQLGCILYELVTGKHAVPGKTRKEVAERCLYEVPAPPSTLNREIDPDLENLVMNVMEKNRDERYADAPAFLADIEAWKKGGKIPRRGSGRPIRDRPGTAPAPAPPEKPRTQAQRRVEPTPGSGATPSPAATPGPDLPPPTRTASNRRVEPGPGDGPGSVPPGRTGPPSTGRSMGPARPGAGSSRSVSMAEPGPDPMDASVRLTRPRQAPEASATKAPAALAIGLGACLVLLLVAFLRSGSVGTPAFGADGLLVREVFAGADLSWTSQAPYPDRLALRVGNEAPRELTFDPTAAKTHRVQLRDLEPGRPVAFRILYPDGTGSLETTFTPLGLAGIDHQSRVVSGLKGNLVLETRRVPARLKVEFPETGAAAWVAPAEATEHQVPVDLPGDGASVRCRVSVLGGPAKETVVVSGLTFQGLIPRVEEVVAGSGDRLAALADLGFALKEFLADRQVAQAPAKVRLLQAMEPLRDFAARVRAAGRPSEPDPEKHVPRSMAPGVDALTGVERSVFRPPGPLHFVDQYTPANAPRVHRERLVFADLPPEAHRAKEAALVLRTLGLLPQSAAALRIGFERAGRLSLYFGDGTRPAGKTELLVQAFDPRLLPEKGAFSVELTFESLTGKALERGLLSIVEAELQIRL